MNAQAPGVPRVEVIDPQDEEDPNDLLLGLARQDHAGSMLAQAHAWALSGSNAASTRQYMIQEELRAQITTIVGTQLKGRFAAAAVADISEEVVNALDRSAAAISATKRRSHHEYTGLVVALSDHTVRREADEMAKLRAIVTAAVAEIVAQGIYREDPPLSLKEKMVGRSRNR